MKNLAFIAIIAIGFSAVILSACDDTETYADKLRKEKAAINRFFAMNNRKIIHEYPENGVFGEGEFFLDPNSGVYFHVIDSGNGRRATTNREVYVRYSNTGGLITANGIDSLCEDSNNVSAYLQDYLNFIYGDESTYTDNTTSITLSNYMYKSEGMAAPLEYVGDSAIIQLIVPFKIGSGYQQSIYEPIYFGWLFYDFRKEQGE
ncbi:MAG: DUF4827 domain-containing protein [Prevotella sp.]|jgi:hypothetical protein|nr:DUF4827 domain-containing protein [Prevotella sp.]